MLPVNADGSLSDATDTHQDKGEPGAAKPEAAVEGSFAISDHNGPHAHMIAADPSGKYVFPPIWGWIASISTVLTIKPGS